MENLFLSLEKVNVYLNRQLVLKDIQFSVFQNEQWAIIGPEGSGKTVLAHTLAGRHFYSGTIKTAFGSSDDFHRFITVVEQQHRFRDIMNRSDFYYQQRFNSFDAERTVTVEEELSSCMSTGQETAAGLSADEIIKLLQIGHLLREPLIQLSNGENKRLQLVKALLQRQQLLILDKPFTGLDVAGRKLLRNILNELSAKGMKLLLITTPHEIPEYITHIAQLENGILTDSIIKTNFSVPVSGLHRHDVIDKKQLQSLYTPVDQDFEVAVKMTDVNISYGNKKILQRIYWEVKKGERWWLAGPNGAGKSTLLSLVTGDNPQAYANEIYLFDRRRGSGESIWDIKKRTGYISPELHLYFDPSATIFQAITSGLFDTIGLFRQPDPDQEKLGLSWIQIMGLNYSPDTLLSRLSIGQQRLVLLARALIKNPPLLILDEPCQGLSEEHIESFKAIIELFCLSYHTTLIYVSHYQHEIPGCINRILQLEAGSIVLSGNITVTDNRIWEIISPRP